MAINLTFRILSKIKHRFNPDAFQLAFFDAHVKRWMQQPNHVLYEMSCSINNDRQGRLNYMDISLIFDIAAPSVQVKQKLVAAINHALNLIVNKMGYVIKDNHFRAHGSHDLDPEIPYGQGSIYVKKNFDRGRCIGLTIRCLDALVPEITPVQDAASTSDAVDEIPNYLEALRDDINHNVARDALALDAISEEFLSQFTIPIAKKIVTESFLKIFLRELENTELLSKVLGIETLVSSDGIRALELGIVSIRQASEFATADELETAINNGLAQHDAAIKIQAAWKGHTVRAKLTVPPEEADGESELAANSVNQLGASA